MKTISTGGNPGERGSSMMVLLFVTVTVVTVAAGITALVTQGSKVTRSRSNMISAIQIAQGAAVIAASDLNTAVTGGSSSSIGYSLIHGSNAYTNISGTIYQRTIAAPFSNQTATVTITLASGSSPATAKVIASATVGGVTQTATLNLKMGWAYPGAIVSVNAGTSDTSNDKPSGQAGNVAINGSSSGPLVINGGSGDAVLANGRVDYDTNYLNPPASAYSQTNWGTANQITDYTAQGTSNSLFDLNKLIAIADLTPNGYNTNSATQNNHFTNIANFMISANSYTNPLHNAMEGVIVVDVAQTDKNLSSLTDSAWKSTTTITAASTDKKTGIVTPASTNITVSGGLPYGINVHGTLLLNFTGTGWDPVTEKIVVTADMNVNAADLSHLVATNTATYASGYPPLYTNMPSHNPTNINITSKGYSNVVAGDDLPALIYSTGCLDMHGNCDISGVLYTPCYVELENKNASSTQYISGMVICGNGMYYENLQPSVSIITFDSSTVDSLLTLGSAGKQVSASYWEP